MLAGTSRCNAAACQPWETRDPGNSDPCELLRSQTVGSRSVSEGLRPAAPKDMFESPAAIWCHTDRVMVPFID